MAQTLHQQVRFAGDGGHRTLADRRVDEQKQLVCPPFPRTRRRKTSQQWFAAGLLSSCILLRGDPSLVGWKLCLGQKDPLMSHKGCSETHWPPTPSTEDATAAELLQSARTACPPQHLTQVSPSQPVDFGPTTFHCLPSPQCGGLLLQPPPRHKRWRETLSVRDSRRFLPSKPKQLC